MQLVSPARRGKERPENLAERIYAQLKDDIFEFRLLPGDRFSEGEIAERMAASRTPVRQALYRLEREGYLEVYFRSGWQVKPFDFAHFEELYEVRIVLELEAVKRLCERPAGELPEALEQLRRTWMVQPEQRLQDGREVSRLDERFHCQLVEAAGNREMARLHAEVSEKIRIIRRLDFTQGPRVELTYEEHARILGAILSRRCEEAQLLLKTHIEVSKAEVRKITLHMLHSARQRALPAQG
ncbi:MULTISPECIES: GntR family transcriptional regulator [Pseudomonadaceae]|jgi:DNA-binding GntR family transcriptional regulator|uniref:Transcriptional regulator, GntR family n=1 Tax=Ectopseudomonas mendocina (strain ymp) TaxID=399739 RepID=A4XQ54_ECTM1|nr:MULTISPECIES: GntR family transcriptional regulator [Pseudomonas]ATH83730.1 GntR family transcriptional regulator [Pseudomonas mendocina]EJO91601.1 GntR family transcriptional regulator [Pseudomonas mendocina DLHK]MBF8159833.1 GntR family transcriptional regulator [Pseudomonas mendocina]MDH0099050.1 GntR family transcriptional regulator [Pseudomonas sp. GD04158]MDR8012921.1 GntR family transcriptional regulator [Pseudomonas guguanensis]